MSEKPSGVGPRIALIHALEESVLPARAAFAEDWPEAFAFDLLDTSLAVDLADAGTLDSAMMAASRPWPITPWGRRARPDGPRRSCSPARPLVRRSTR